jgi:hypothetical protein
VRFWCDICPILFVVVVFHIWKKQPGGCPLHYG